MQINIALSLNQDLHQLCILEMMVVYIERQMLMQQIQVLQPLMIFITQLNIIAVPFTLLLLQYWEELKIMAQH